MISMSGLDLSFLKEPAKKKRGRPRKHPVKAKSSYQRQMDEIKARAASRPSKRADFGAPVVMADITPFVSPIDGSEITSRSKLKAHEQRHGVKQAGDFKKGEIIAKENKRIEDSLRGAEMETVKWE
jgi:hypothetical protein